MHVMIYSTNDEGDFPVLFILNYIGCYKRDIFIMHICIYSCIFMYLYVSSYIFVYIYIYLYRLYY